MHAHTDTQFLKLLLLFDCGKNIVNSIQLMYMPLKNLIADLNSSYQRIPNPLILYVILPYVLYFLIRWTRFELNIQTILILTQTRKFAGRGLVNFTELPPTHKNFFANPEKEERQN